MVSNVWGTWFRMYGVPDLESTGYIISRVRYLSFFTHQHDSGDQAVMTKKITSLCVPAAVRSEL